MSAKYKSPSFLLPNELNTNTNPLNTDGNPATGTGINSLYSMNFDASSTQEISLGTISEISSGSDFSISLWFKAQHTGGYDTMYGSGTTAANDIYIAIDESKNIEIGVRGQRLIHVATNIVNNIWYHFVLTVEGTTYKAYLDNGTPATGSTGTNTANSGDNAVLGDFSWTGNFHFNGQMDEVAIFNRALNTTEIAALYDGTGSNIRPSNLMATNLGPLAYYPLGEQAQNSGYPGNTTPANNVWQFPNGVLQDYVMDFDGGNYIDVGENILPSGNFTISAWVKPDSFPIPYATIFSSYENSASGRLLFRIKNDGKLELSLDSATLTSNTSLSANTWQHVMVALNGTSLTFYLNGSSDGSGTASTPPAQNLTTYIGAWDNSGSPNGYFNGEISNLAIWNSDQATNKDNIYNNGSPQTSYTVTPQNWWKLNADSVYTPSAPNYTTALDFDNSPTGQGVIYSPTSLPSTSSWSVSFWAVSVGSTKQWLWSVEDAGIHIDNVYIRFTGTAAGDITMGTIPFSKGDLFHMLASYDGSTLKVYIDGSEFYSGNVTTNISTDYITIGGWNRYGYPTGNVYYGYSQTDIMSNFAVWDSALTASQVSTIFNFGTPETNISFSPRNYYKLDNTTTGLNDLGSGGANAFISGTGITQVNSSVAVVPSWKIPSALPIPTVNYTSALSFDGGNRYINCGTGFGNALGNYSGDLTISLWLNRFSNANQKGIFYFGGFGNNRGILEVYGGGTGVSVLAGGTMNSGGLNELNKWYHLCIVYKAGDINNSKVYVNGQSQTTTTTGSYASSKNFSGNSTIIGGYYGPLYTFNGLISNAALFTSELLSPQVLSLYNDGQPESSISFSPTSWWKLNNLSNGLLDSGSSNNDGTNSGSSGTVKVDSNVYVGNVPVNGVSTTLPSTALQQSDLQFDSPYSNYSLSFDGAGDYIQTGGFTIGNNYTFSCWLKSDTISPSNMCFLSSPNYYSVGYNGNFVIRFTSATQIQMYSYNAIADSESSTVTIPSIDTNWHHFALTSNGTTTNIYWDGSPLTVTGNQTKSLDNISQGLIIGDNITGNNNAFNGKIDETAVWNTALTEAQVLEIYNNGRPNDLSTFSGTAPVSWWRLGENAYFDNNSFIVPNSISGAPNGTGSGTITTMISADAPGTYANGIGTNLDILDRVGDAALSTSNSQSYNMIPDDKVPYVPGYVGAQTNNVYSMAFDGTNYFNTSFTALNGLSQSTISIWAKTSNVTLGRFLYGNRDTGYNGLACSTWTDGNIYFYCSSASSLYFNMASAGIQNNQWFNLVFVFDGLQSSNTDKVKMYVNKNLITYTTSTTFPTTLQTSSKSFKIGHDGQGSAYWNGLIDEVAIFDKALTPYQVQFDLYEPTALVGGVEKTADIANNTNLPTPLAWYRMGD